MRVRVHDQTLKLFDQRTCPIHNSHYFPSTKTSRSHNTHQPSKPSKPIHHIRSNHHQRWRCLHNHDPSPHRKLPRLDPARLLHGNTAHLRSIHLAPKPARPTRPLRLRHRHHSRHKPLSAPPSALCCRRNPHHHPHRLPNPRVLQNTCSRPTDEAYFSLTSSRRVSSRVMAMWARDRRGRSARGRRRTCSSAR
jgi:hypothetical protein